MVAKQRIRMANEKHSKNITQRGNVSKSTVNHRVSCSDSYYSHYFDIYVIKNRIYCFCLRYSKRLLRVFM